MTLCIIISWAVWTSPSVMNRAHMPNISCCKVFVSVFVSHYTSSHHPKHTTSKVMQILTAKMIAPSIWLSIRKTNLCARNTYLPAIPKEKCLVVLTKCGVGQEQKKKKRMKFFFHNSYIYIYVYRYTQLFAKLILAKVPDGWGSFFKPFQGKKISSTLQFTEPYKSARDHK